MNNLKINAVKKLYHGTDQYFESYDLSFAKGFKDFGKGFYLTSNFVQAQKWAQQKSFKKGLAYIYTYDISNSISNDIKILELLQYDKEWVDFICDSRINGIETDYDIIYDRIADSRFLDIADTLQKYSDKTITANEALNKIKWNNFAADQYCFKSIKAISLLENKHILVQRKDESGKWKQEGQE